jgi:molecular chaperone DnaK (HSP70)
VVPHISKEHFVSNPNDNQTEIRVEVLQGTRDATLADQCVRLGHVDMNILPRPAGSHKIKIVFDVKSDGTMKVIVTDERTGHSVTEDITEGKTIRFVETAAEVKQ